MNYLFFDTETTGLVKDWNDPSNELNPRLVQLGMCLCNEKGRILNTFSSIVIPEGFTIPDEAAAIHGITTEFASKCGDTVDSVINMFAILSYRADLVIAHNYKFDRVIIEHEVSLLPQDKYMLKIGPEFCTMLESTNLCRLPSKRGGYKWPKLSEAYHHFFGEELKEAHDALTDVMACKRIFFEGLKAPSLLLSQPAIA